MCTCITFKNNGFYFGRNLDLERSFGEQAVVMPRAFPLRLQNQTLREHPAVIGTAHVTDGTPLFAEAMNEHGLCAAGLYFPQNAVYRPPKRGKTNVAAFELITWVLCRFETAAEAQAALQNVNITDRPFRPDMPATALHWMIADSERCLTVEQTEDGLHVYENKFGVLTNNPPFPFQCENMRTHMALSPYAPENRFAPSLGLTPYGQGMGAVGLPGDASPPSRFVRAAFLKHNSVCGKDEAANVTQVFHILDSVSMCKGSVITPQGGLDHTVYASCISTSTNTFYYKTYDNSQITAIRLKEAAKNGKTLLTFPFETKQQIRFEN